METREPVGSKYLSLRVFYRVLLFLGISVNRFMFKILVTTNFITQILTSEFIVTSKSVQRKIAKVILISAHETQKPSESSLPTTVLHVFYVTTLSNNWISFELYRPRKLINFLRRTTYDFFIV